MHWKCPIIAVLGDFRGRNCKISFWTSRGTSLAQNARFDVSLVQIGSRVWSEKQKQARQALARRNVSPPGDAIFDPIRAKFGPFTSLLYSIITTNFQLIRLRTECVRPCWKFRIMANIFIQFMMPPFCISIAPIAISSFFHSRCMWHNWWSAGKDWILNLLVIWWKNGCYITFSELRPFRLVTPGPICVTSKCHKLWSHFFTI